MIAAICLVALFVFWMHTFNERFRMWLTITGSLSNGAFCHMLQEGVAMVAYIHLVKWGLS